MIKEVIVVEGRSDTIAVQRAVQADTIETGGSAVSEDLIERIRLAQQKRGVIIFTDPDFPGETIRRIISEAVPGCKHAFITRKEGRKNDSVGVEHASPDSIRKALSEVKTEAGDRHSDIRWTDMIEFGLVGGPFAKDRRLKLGEQFGIGYGNAKQFYKRLQMFQVSRQALENAVNSLNEEDAAP